MLAVTICTICVVAMLVGLAASLVAWTFAARPAIAGALAFRALPRPVPRATVLRPIPRGVLRPTAAGLRALPA